MSRLEILGELVAERRLVLACADGAVLDVVVRFGRPVPMDGGNSLADDCWCSVQVVVGAAPRAVRAIGGVDAMQALQLAIVAADDELALIEGELSGKLAWQGGGVYARLASRPDLR
ncbi:MAG: hypothetical protein U5L03_10590 [Burkholderiaceae bacterium]|nr:hypothetical protein [Burkholderiaceae bacterium]